MSQEYTDSFAIDALADEAGGYFMPPTDEAIRHTELF